MIRDEERIDPKHGEIRHVLRVVGLVLAGVGVVMIVVGVASFFSVFSSFGGGGPMGPPRYFWCAFVGIPLLGIGLSMSSMGFMGAIARYQAGEVAPVGKDAFNYLAEETQDGVKAVASAVATGLSEGWTGTAPTAACVQCGHANRPDAKFCGQCGSLLALGCPSCGQANDAHAKFCTRCGGKLAQPS